MLKASSCFLTKATNSDSRRSVLGGVGFDISKRVPTVLVVPLTSQLDALRFPGTVLVEPDAENGLRRASVALVFQLTAIDQRYLRDRLGKVSQSLINEIFLALDELAGRT